MRKLFVVLLSMVLLAHVQSSPLQAQAAISFTITPLGESGITGSGTVTPGPGTDESTHLVQWQGLQPGTVHAVSQYHGTSCASYDAAPEFVFAAVTADSQGKAAASITVKKPFANWPRRPHFLILHAEADAGSPAVACGTIVVPAQASAAPSPSAPAASPTAAPVAAPSATIPFTIMSLGGSGITGSGMVTPGPGTDESTHSVQWQGLQPGAVHAVSQYHGTSCDSYDAAPEFVFNPVMADSQGKAAASIVVQKPFANWPRRPHFLLLHATADPAAAAVACGPIVVPAQASAAPDASVAASAPAPVAPPSTPQSLPNTGDRSWPRELLIVGSLLGVGVGVTGRLVSRTRQRRR